MPDYIPSLIKSHAMSHVLVNMITIINMLIYTSENRNTLVKLILWSSSEGSSVLKLSSAHFAAMETQVVAG